MFKIQLFKVSGNNIWTHAGRRQDPKTVLGSFQGSSDTNNDNWLDSGNDYVYIANAAFVQNIIPGYA